MSKRRVSKREKAALRYLLQAVHRLAVPGILGPLMESVVLEDALSIERFETVMTANERMAVLERENDVVFVNNSSIGSKNYLLVMQEVAPGSVPYSFLPYRNGIGSIPGGFVRKLGFLSTSNIFAKEQGYPPLIVEKHADSHRGEGLRVLTLSNFCVKPKVMGPIFIKHSAIHGKGFRQTVICVIAGLFS